MRQPRSRPTAEGRLAKTVGASEAGVFTSDLSAQDFFRLLAAGAVPVSFVLDTCRK